MGMFDNLFQQALGGNSGGLGAIIAMATKNPSALTALGDLLNSRTGGTGGVHGLVEQFQKQGLGDIMSGWVAKGQNPAISSEQIAQVFSADTLNTFASKAGVAVAEAQSMLANLLPAAVDQLTPDGHVPDASSLDATIASLMARFGR